MNGNFSSNGNRFFSKKINKNGDLKSEDVESCRTQTHHHHKSQHQDIFGHFYFL